MNLNRQTTMIIPAAGYGRRVGSPPAKEILFRAGTNEPMIDGPINWGQERGLRVLVVTRRNKQVLIDHLTQNHKSVNLSLIEDSNDWQSTILQIKSEWTQKNIIVLPDTEFSPLEVLDQMPALLDQFDVVTARHSVEDASQWGHVWSLNESSFVVAEKPIFSINQTPTAWGLIGFRDEIGEDLLKSQWLSQENKEIREIQGRLGFVELAGFRDLTR
jgi:hypothetical protein